MIHWCSLQPPRKIVTLVPPPPLRGRIKVGSVNLSPMEPPILTFPLKTLYVKLLEKNKFRQWREPPGVVDAYEQPNKYLHCRGFSFPRDSE